MKPGLCAAVVSAMLCGCAAGGHPRTQQDAIAVALARIEAEAACAQAAARTGTRDRACFAGEMAARGYPLAINSTAGR